MSPFYERMPDVGGFGIEREIDVIGAALAAGAVGGVLAHAAATGVNRMRERKKGRELPVIHEPPPNDSQQSPKS